MQIVIVGAGIAGLTTALAFECLVPKGRVTLVEQAPSLEPVGAGIVLWPNALRVLEELGIPAETLATRGRVGALGGIRTPSGRWLQRLDPRPEERPAAYHRADLVALLREPLGPTDIVLGAQVTRVEPTGEVTWHQPPDTDHRVSADVAVAADGIHSPVRRAHWAIDPRPSGIVCARAVVPVAIESGAETWGRGAMAGYVPLTDGRTYVYAARRTPWDGHDLAWLAAWPDPFPTLAAAAAGQDLIVAELASLPPVRPWVRGRIALVGDAAHAMLPFLGQGACQGIEDAFAVARAIASGDLAAYERARRQRALAVSRASRSASLVALADGWRAAVRDAAMPWVPPVVTRASMARFTTRPHA